ncbi:MAG: hypothetical protein RBS38_03055 [Bacteroidales bacterium]|jgi:hypothetical protein|nr:hypothetical protein [Bacteroidales bacterium]
MLENLTGYYREADGQTKRKILGCIFSEKLVFEKGKDATIPFTEPIQVLFKIARVLQGSKNKKEVENDLLSTLAPLTAESCNRLKDFLMIKSGFQNCNFYWTGF